MNPPSPGTSPRLHQAGRSAVSLPGELPRLAGLVLRQDLAQVLLQHLFSLLHLVHGQLGGDELALSPAIALSRKEFEVDALVHRGLEVEAKVSR